MTTLSVPDMSCGHCKTAVETALAPLCTQVLVDLPARQLRVDAQADPAAILRALAAVGFPAQIISA